MYTEYVFESKKIDVALCQIKAAILDIVSGEQEKISSVREKADSIQDEDIKEILGRLCSEQEECVQKLMSFSNELAKILKKLDSYSRELKRVEDKSNALIVEDLNRKVELAEQLLSSQPQIRELVEAASNGQNVDELIARMGQGYSTDGSQTVEVEEPQVIESGEPQIVDSVEPVVETEPETIVEETDSSTDDKLVMPYNDDISTINDIAPLKVEDPQGEAPVEGETKAEDSEAPAAGEEKVIMPYNDDISTIKDIPPLKIEEPGEATTDGEVKAEGSETPAAGEEKVIIPYNDDISTIKDIPPLKVEEPGEATTDGEVKAEGSEAPAAGEEKVIIPYNDDISTIKDIPPLKIEAPGEATTDGEAKTEGSETPVEGETKVEGSEAPATGEEKVIIPYNDDISTIKDIPPLKIEESGEATTDGEVKVEGSETPIEGTGDTTEILSMDESSTEVSPVIQTTDVSLPETTTEAAVFSEPVIDTMKSEGPIPVIVPSVSTPADSAPTENTSDSQKMIFQKKGSDAAKVILTSATQTTKLRGSLATQEALLSAKGFFAKSNDSDMTQKETEIQDMMNQANQLYNDGKVDEAQKMYDDISVISKTLKLNESVGIAA